MYQCIFQQSNDMPDEVTRTDSMPVKYQKDKVSGHYKPVVDKKTGTKKSWNLGRLSSRENPLVIFTLSVQAAIGAFISLFVGNLLGFDVITSVIDSNAYLVVLAAGLGLVGSVRCQ